MNKTIFSFYNDFIARAVIGSCGRASRIDLSVRTAKVSGETHNSSQNRTQCTNKS